MHSKMFEKIKLWHEQGLWTDEMVRNAVPKLLKRIRKNIAQFVEDNGTGGYDIAVTGYDCLAMDVQTITRMMKARAAVSRLERLVA